MASEVLHEAGDDLTSKTRNLHRALISLQEELEAIDWYRQHADTCNNADLKAVLSHNIREGMERAAMLIESLLLNNTDLEQQLRDYLFTDASITEVEEAAAG